MMAKGRIMPGLYTTLGRHNFTLGESAPHDAKPSKLGFRVRFGHWMIFLGRVP